MNNYDLYYYPNVCHVCKSADVDLKICASCKIYRYCSVEHQEIHWPSHKVLCKIFKRYMKSNDLNNCFEAKLRADWIQTRTDVKTVMERNVGRRLRTSENQVWMFPRACAVCHSVDVKKLFDCKKCPATSFCSAEHKYYADHAKFCRLMSVQFIYYKSLSYGILLDAPLESVFPTEGIPYEHLECTIFDKSQDIKLRNIRQSEKFSHLFSIFHVLKLSDIVEPDMISFYSSKERLTFHIVGAIHEYEFLDRHVCELLFHWISNLKQIEIIFIGPELLRYKGDNYGFCNKCRKKNVKISYEFKHILYSEYFSSANYKQPNLIAIFNCGFSEFNDCAYDTWKDSIKFMMMPNIPILITSYTYQEALDDFKKLTKCINSEVSHDVLEYCSKNKYSGMLPLRDWTKPLDVYYVNNYMSVIKKRGE